MLIEITITSDKVTKELVTALKALQETGIEPELVDHNLQPVPKPTLPPLPHKAPEVEEAKVTREQVRDAMKPLVRTDKGRAKALLDKYGNGKLSDVPEDQLAALLEEVQHG